MDFRYDYTLCLYIAFGSAKNWLKWILDEKNELHRKVEILMFIIDFVLSIFCKFE